MSRHVQLLKESLVTIERLEARLHASENARHEPLAIVGAGCRFPGGVDDPEALWRLVRDGVDAVSEIPRERWDRDAYYDADPKAPGKMITKRGGFLSQVDRFEPQLFGISPREAATMDPQQRLLLETSWEALESAGIPTDRLAGSATGVFVGITTSDYAAMLRIGGPENSDVYSATGSALNAAAGRVSFTFGLQGPCVAVDTACSSSLVAVHLACQSLRAGETDLALAGAVNLVLSPDAMILFSKWGMMAPDGACKTFDAAADGFVRSEGCAVLAIKRLADALAARDPILAVIRGTAVNSDGRSSGLTVPNGPAQRAVLQKALASARLEPSDIDYVEAHGTGTSLGDPIEVEALGAVMRQGRPADRPLLIGSIKTNIGHAEAVSGLAGLLKVVGALRHEAIPAHLHFSTPNPRIPWDALPLAVPTTLTPWPRTERKRRAGVSAFGFSGTNAHVILEEAPLPTPEASTPEIRSVVVPLSAREELALHAIALRTADFVAADASLSLADVAVATGTGRAHLGRRVAFVTDSKTSLIEDLRAFAAGQTPATAAEGALRPGERPKIAFVFTGQGSQYPGMGKGLYDSEPVFRETLDRAAAILAPRLEKPLLDVLFPGEGASTPLGETAYTQPALFALEYAVTALWRSWGIAPAIVLGHSVGEYVAATVAGVMTFEEGLTLIAERGRLMQELPSGGSMAAVFADEATVSRTIAPWAARLGIAALNGPSETVISGDADALTEALAAFVANGIKCRALEVSHAFHSARLDPMLDALERAAGAVATASPRIPLVSNLTGVPFTTRERPDAGYWRRHAREPVRFAAGIEALRAAGVTAIVEVGPHPTLLALVSRASVAGGPNVATAASLRRGRDDRREMLSALALLYTRGASVSWDAVDGKHLARRRALPTYPFQRDRHWLGTPAHVQAPLPAGHPLLGERRELASAPGTYVWETAISLERHPWLRDHRVHGTAVVPGTAFVEMALAAGSDVFGGPGGAAKRPLEVVAIESAKPLVLREGETRSLQTTLVVDEGHRARFSVHSRTSGSDWTAHVTAQVAIAAADARDGRGGVEDVEAIRRRCPAEIDGGSFYAALAAKGNAWGPAFQGLERVWVGEGEALGRVRAPESLIGEAGRYHFHPALSAACGHVLVGAIPSTKDGAFVGGTPGDVRFNRSPKGTTLWVHAQLRPPVDGDGAVVGDLRVYDDDGGLVCETSNARLTRFDASMSATLVGAPRDWYYEVRWNKAERGARRDRAAAAGLWILFADRIGIGQAIASRRAAAGQRCVFVTAGDAFTLDGDRATIRASDPEDVRRLLEALPHPAAVVHLGSIGAPENEVLVAGPASVVAVLHGLVGVASAARPRLWLVTGDTQAAVEGDPCSDPFGAALWGMGRALSAENAELWGGLVDVSTRSPSESIAERLIEEVEAGAADDQVAFRDGQRYAARLERMDPAEGAAREYAAGADGTYLVTGGLGGIGLAMAGWLVERGARHLLLLGRTPLPPRESWATLGAPSSAVARRVAAVMALEAAGARVETAAVDIGLDGALENCLDARRTRGEPPVRGVIHAAGILHFEALASQSVASLRTGLSAKIDGAWRLHRVLEHEPLDCFVMCSSSSALLRSPLLGTYAGGNAFLDALAHHRRSKGLPALSINWGTWGEVGMAAEADRGAMLSGMNLIGTSQGLAAMGELLGARTAQAAVMPIDWARLARAYPGYARDPFVADLVGESGHVETKRTGAGAALSALREATDSARPELLSAYLRLEAARTLGMTGDDLDPAVALSAFGFDSLMAVQLKNQIEADLGIVVPMVQFLDGPSLDFLLPAVLGAMGEVTRGQVAEGASAEVWEEGSI